MKNTSVQIKLLSGLFEKLPQTENGATELNNWTVDKYTGGWDNRIGYERYNPLVVGDFLPRLNDVSMSAEQAIYK